MKIDINKDPEEIKDMAWKGFSAKEVITLLISVAAGGLTFWLARPALGEGGAALLPPIICAPVILAGFGKSNGQPFWTAVKNTVSFMLFNRELHYVSSEECKRTPTPHRQKTVKKGKPLNKYRIKDDVLFKRPNSAQETIDIVRVYKNGIFELPDNNYSRAYMFTDINYKTLSDEQRVDKLESWCRFLTMMNVRHKVIINSKYKNKKTLRDTVLFKHREDEFDSFRELFNRQIYEKLMTGRQGIEQERTLVVTVAKKNYEEAQSYFIMLESSLKDSFEAMGSQLVPLDARGRLRQLHDYYRMSQDETFDFDYDTCVELCQDFKNDICNSSLKYYPTMISDDNKFVRVVFVRRYPRDLSDELLNELSTLPFQNMIAIDNVPIAREDTEKMLHDKYLGVEHIITEQQKVRNRNRAYSSDISFLIRNDQKKVIGLLDDTENKDQDMYYISFMMLIIAGSAEELAEHTDSVRLVMERNGCKLDMLGGLQRECLNTMLPIGVRQVHVARCMLTRSAAVLHPFCVEELYQPGYDAKYYGINAVSKNLVFCGRKTLPSPHGWIFGETGFGKSVAAKNEMIQTVIDSTNDDIIVVDPKNEYFDVAERFGGAAISFSANARYFSNPLEINWDSDTLTEDISEKVQFLWAFVEQCKKAALTSQEMSIIDSCARTLYTEFGKTKAQPLLGDFREKLRHNSRMESDELATVLELYTEGTLNMFAKPSNIDVNSRIMVFGLAELGKSLWSLAMEVMLIELEKRVYKNYRNGRTTRIYIDEASTLLKDERMAAVFAVFWKKLRAWGAIITGIMQNAIDLLSSSENETLLSNSQFFILLRQSERDCSRLAQELHIPLAMHKYMLNAKPGTGLIRFGDALVPFDSQMDKESELYKIVNTNFYEKIGEQ